MGVRTPARRHSLFISVAVMALGFLSAFADPAAGATQASLAIFDDDGDRALFTGPLTMAPGRSYTQCLQVGATSADGGDMVRVGASDVSGDLASALWLTIDVGDGGRFGDCSAFTGAPLFAGTLAQLAAAGGGEGVATGWQPATIPDRSFRITASLDGGMRDQGLTAQGSFVWRLVDVSGSGLPIPSGSPTPTPTPTPVPAPTPTPSVTVPGDPSPSPSEPGTSPTATPTPTPTEPSPSVRATAARPGAGAERGGGGQTAGGVSGSPDITIGGTLAQLGTVVRRAQQAVVAVVTSPQYPLTAIFLALGFLLVQDLIDRRDPKLAVAKRRQRENEIEFPDRFHQRVSA